MPSPLPREVRRLRLFAGAAATVLLVAASATTGTAGRRAGAAAAATPFATAWAHVPRTSAARRAKSVLVFGIGTDVNGFNLALACCSLLQAGFMGGFETGRGAFLQNDEGTWVKDIVSKASANTKGVSYTIRPGAYWYWGGRKLPVTYKDFVYTLQKIDDPRSLVAVRTGYGNLDPSRYIHEGLKRVTFFWKTKNCTADLPCGPIANWRAIFSALYPSAALAGQDFNAIWTDCICGSDGKPVSDGPFYMSNYTKGQGTTLKANPFFYGKKPGLAEIDMKVFADTNSEVQAMRAVEIDAIAPPFDTNLLPLESTPGLTFMQIPAYYFDYVEFREAKGASNALLRAPYMRQAIALGIDRRGIIKSVYGRLAGKTKPMNNMIYYPTQAQYRPDFARWDYNPARALALLKKHCTGGPSNPSTSNSAVWQCSGIPARFRWSWTSGVATRATTEAIAKEELRSIGIDLIEYPLPANELFGPTGLPSGNFDIAQVAYITTGDPSDWYDAWRCGGPANETGYCSNKASTLMRVGNAELDPAKRAADFQAADRLMTAAVPILPLYQRPAALIYRSGILGMKASPGGFGPVWNIEDWRWKP
jgi:ABC-type transport system substrate-binding protein